MSTRSSLQAKASASLAWVRGACRRRRRLLVGLYSLLALPLQVSNMTPPTHADGHQKQSQLGLSCQPHHNCLAPRLAPCLSADITPACTDGDGSYQFAVKAR